MILELTVHPEWGSNGYLMAGGPGCPALVVDPGPPVDELLRVAAEQDLDISHVVITHRHDDHHEQAARIREAFPDTVIIAHAIERPHIGLADTDAQPGTRIEIDGLTLQILETRDTRSARSVRWSTVTCSPGTRCSKARSAG